MINSVNLKLDNQGYFTCYAVVLYSHKAKNQSCEKEVQKFIKNKNVIVFLVGVLSFLVGFTLQNVPLLAV